jgi:hypothetical protein
MRCAQIVSGHNNVANSLPQIRVVRYTSLVLVRRVSLVAVVFAASCSTVTPPPRVATVAQSHAQPKPTGQYVTLAFDDFFVKDARNLEPTPALMAANGRRVRIVGFMAQMELPPRSGFYLTRRPVFCDEAGGGTADLPPDAVRVVVLSEHPTEIPFLPGPLAIVGILDVGHKEEPDGTVSRVRLLLRGEPAAANAARTKSETATATGTATGG